MNHNNFNDKSQVLNKKEIRYRGIDLIEKRMLLRHI